ncbi:MAG: ABC transporter permease, partial [Rhodothermales bacterium]
MLRNYLAVALRNLARNKGYAFINVAGLAVGLACFILIFLFIEHEHSYDRFYENGDKIHRVVQRQPGNVFLGSDYFAVTPAPLAPTLVEEFPEVSAATTVSSQSALLSSGDQHFWEEGIWADPHFFDVFSFDLRRGRGETALAEPGSIILTESLAAKIFGDLDPIGQSLLHQNRDTYTVTGIVEDPPENSTLRFDFVTTLLSQSNYANNLAKQAWNNNSWHTFFMLAPGADAADLQAKMPALVEKYVADEDDEPAERNQYIVQPLSDIHLRSTVNFDMGVRGDIRYVYLFAAIGLVILLLACVNYTNLAVARSIKRTREVGMRKVVG